MTCRNLALQPNFGYCVQEKIHKNLVTLLGKKSRVDLQVTRTLHVDRLFQCFETKPDGQIGNRALNRCGLGGV